MITTQVERSPEFDRGYRMAAEDAAAWFVDRFFGTWRRATGVDPQRPETAMLNQWLQALAMDFGHALLADLGVRVRDRSPQD